ncbi:MAG: hypothetical protein WA888_19250 [Burkholderiaceae bacterium]
MNKTSVFGFIGISLGAVALMAVLVHLWVGEFTPPPSLDSVVAEKVQTWRDSLMAQFRGGEPASATDAVAAPIDIDWLLGLGVVIFSALAVIAGVVSFARHESNRASAGAVFLGLCAIAFQLSGVTIGIATVAVLLAVVVLRFGVS